MSRPAVPPALDIAALVEAWLFDVGSVCRYVKTLAGCTASMEQQRDNQQRGWLPVRTGGIGRCSFMSPLVASSDAASHATHLYAQLSLHKACRDSLLGLKQTLSSQADTAGKCGGNGGRKGEGPGDVPMPMAAGATLRAVLVKLGSWGERWCLSCGSSHTRAGMHW